MDFLEFYNRKYNLSHLLIIKDFQYPYKVLLDLQLLHQEFNIFVTRNLLFLDLFFIVFLF